RSLEEGILLSEFVSAFFRAAPITCTCLGNDLLQVVVEAIGELPAGVAVVGTPSVFFQLFLVSKRHGGQKRFQLSPVLVLPLRWPPATRGRQQKPYEERPVNQFMVSREARSLSRGLLSRHRH